jgi:16S rRNA (uracil1498-N3)-methyltransferase
VKTPPWLLVERGSLEAGRILKLDPAEGQHATGPLRLVDGDGVVLADGRGATAPSVLRVRRRGAVEAEVGEVHAEPPPASGGVLLALAVIDSRAMDWAVQKAVEVGVRRLTPLASERSQLRRRDTGRRLEHWRRVALQAIKQCRRPWAMEVDEIVDPVQLLAHTPHSCGLLADPGGQQLAAVPEGEAWVLAVGPEGGFSDHEVQLFEDAGWRGLRLGPHILRTETAAVVGAALLATRLKAGS